MVKSLKKNLSSFNYVHYLVFLAVLLIPFIYKNFIRLELFESASEITEKISKLGVHHNFVWLSFIFIVITETFFFPLIHQFGIELKDQNYKVINNKLQTLLITQVAVIIIFLAIALCVLSFIPEDMLFQGGVGHLEEITHAEILSYSRIELITLALTSILNVLFLLFQLKKRRVLLYLGGLQLGLLIITDLILFNIKEVNLNLFALSEIIVSVVLIIVCIVEVFRHFQIKIFQKFKYNFVYLVHFFHGGHHAFIDAVLVDLAAILVFEVFAPVELSASFLTGVVLLPINALAILLRSDIAIKKNYKDIKQVIKTYAVAETIITLIWFSLVTIGVFFLQTKQQIIFFESEHEFSKVQEIIIIFILYGVIKAVYSLIQAIFYGTGHLNYLTNQAIISTIITFFPLMILDLLNVEFDQIFIIISLGLSLLINVAILLHYLKKQIPTYLKVNTMHEGHYHKDHFSKIDKIEIVIDFGILLVAVLLEAINLRWLAFFIIGAMIVLSILTFVEKDDAHAH